MRVYCAGPMTGQPMSGFPAFDAAAEQLRERGHIPVTPADIDRHFGFDGSGAVTEEFRRFILIEDLKALETCNAVLLLPGWEHSRGAAVEVAYARYCDIPVFQHIEQLAEAA